MSLPEGWRETTLGELATISSSKRIFHSEYVTEGIPFYRSKEIIEKQKGNNVSIELFITEEKYNEIKNKYAVPTKNDLLLTSVGTLGIPYLVKEDEIFYFKDGNLTWFREYADLKPLFLYYFFLSSTGKERLNEITIGSTQSALTISGLKQISINLPSFKEQKAIVSILSSFDEKVELLKEQNEILEKMAQESFKELVMKKIENTNRVVTLEDITIKITDGSHKSPKSVDMNGYPMASVKDMLTYGINIESCRKISKNDYLELVKNGCKPLKNDILIAKDGSYLKHIFLLEEEINLVLLSSIAILRTNELYNPLLLKIFLQLSTTKRDLENIVSGAVIPRIVLKDFRKFKLKLPSKDIQLKALKVILPLHKKIINNMSQIQTLQKTRDTLLPKLMSGELRVEEKQT